MRARRFPALTATIASAVAPKADATTVVPKCATNTAYAGGQQVVSPNGDNVSAVATFTSGASYNAGNWNLTNSFIVSALAGREKNDAGIAKSMQPFHAALAKRYTGNIKPPTFLLIAEPGRGDATSPLEAYPKYVDKLNEIAASDPTVMVMDLYRSLGITPVTGITNTSSGGLIHADKVHFSDFGAQWAADMMRLPQALASAGYPKVSRAFFRACATVLIHRLAAGKRATARGTAQTARFGTALGANNQRVNRRPHASQ